MLEALEKILDIEFKPDIDISVLNFTKIEGEDRFQADGRTLHLNIEELEPEQVEQLQELPRQQFESEGRVLRSDEEEEVNAIEAGYDDEFDEIVEYFEPIISDRYHSILEASLHLRALINQKDLSKEEIQDRKREIARKHGGEAVYLSSLTSAGYFDPDGGLRNLYLDMGLNKQYDRLNFQQELEVLVDNKILCVFVESNDDVWETTTDVRSQLKTHLEIEPIHDWLDIRGIGGSCEEVIEGVVTNLEDEFIGIDYDRWSSEDGGTAVRIHPHSLPHDFQVT